MGCFRREKMRWVVSIVAIAMAFGCGAEPPRADFYTPYGIPVATHGYSINPEKLDRKYLLTTECLGYDEARQEARKDSFIVEIRGHDDGNGFRCGDASPTRRCNGLYDPKTDTIMVLDSLSAFSHELTHHLTGHYGNDNDLVKTCGDGIDGLINGELPE